MELYKNEPREIRVKTERQMLMEQGAFYKDLVVPKYVEQKFLKRLNEMEPLEDKRKRIQMQKAGYNCV